MVLDKLGAANQTVLYTYQQLDEVIGEAALPTRTAAAQGLEPRPARTSSPSQLAKSTERRGCQPRLTSAPKPLTISLSAAAPEIGSEAPSVQATTSAAFNAR